MISYRQLCFNSFTGTRNDVESLIGEAREIRDGLFEKQIQIDWQKSKFLRLTQCFRWASDSKIYNHKSFLIVAGMA